MLKEMFGIKKGDVISVVGAGGKTSFMFKLAEELRKDFKVLITTSTKIYVPSRNQYDYMVIGDDNYLYGARNGIYVYSTAINEDNKLVGIDEKSFNKFIHKFDIIICESDGSKKKPIKGWGEYEPVIHSSTNITVGVLPIDVIGKSVDEENVHRLSKFMELTGTKIGDEISVENIVTVVKSPLGLFKNSIGKKILFLSKVNSEEERVLSEKIFHKLKENNLDFMKFGNLL